MSYTTLQADIANYFHRTDLTAVIPNFIPLAESFLFRELRVKELQIMVTGTTTDSYVTLPTDFGSVAKLTVTYGGVERSLDYIAQAESNVTNFGNPSNYSLDNNKLRIWGSGTNQAYTLYYVPKISNLGASVSTNWILDNAADLYLYASCVEGAKYLRDDAELQKLTSLLPPIIESVKRYSERRGQPSTGSMQIKVRR